MERLEEELDIWGKRTARIGGIAPSPAGAKRLSSGMWRLLRKTSGLVQKALCRAQTSTEEHDQFTMEPTWDSRPVLKIEENSKEIDPDDCRFPPSFLFTK
ncbi:hypothetical protein Q8A73_004136 [Channa argus]|nr:hypothetical protein Q8A73_004136 [Channa argus]